LENFEIFWNFWKKNWKFWNYLALIRYIPSYFHLIPNLSANHHEFPPSLRHLMQFTNQRCRQTMPLELKDVLPTYIVVKVRNIIIVLLLLQSDKNLPVFCKYQRWRLIIDKINNLLICSDSRSIFLAVETGNAKLYSLFGNVLQYIRGLTANCFLTDSMVTTGN
jgi:hypothetical protein